MGEQGPLISVIVPVFNGARFLAETLDSVFAQDYEPMEVIVVDDGSADASSHIARSYENVHHIRQENRGPAAARNAGMDAATGELLTFLDADDLMMPTKVSRQARYLLERPGIACVLCRSEPFNDPDAIVPPWLTNLTDLPVPTESSPPERWAGFLRAGGVTAMVRADAIVAIGPFDPRLRFAEDVEWLFRAWDSGVGLAVLDDVLVRKRIHGANMTHDRGGSREGWMRFVKLAADRRRARGARSAD